MFETNYRLMGSIAAALVLGACNAANTVTDATARIDVGQVGKTAADLAKQCGIDVECKAGIAGGNASISGVASVDAFFASVLNYQTTADHVSADIDAKLSAVRADFGIAADADLKAELMTQIAQNLEGGVNARSEPAHCAVDTQAIVDAEAQCDESLDAAKVTAMCDGECDVESDVQVDCGTDAELLCTIALPTGTCDGGCTGTCTAKLVAAAKCDGVCRGACDGNCSAFSDGKATICAGACDGMCQGDCEAQMMSEASCGGACTGECTVSAPNGECRSAVRAHCDRKAAGMVSCRGRCAGEMIPPKGMPECEARARAEAKLNVVCTPPRLVLDYTLKADADANAQARFTAALENLRVRLPELSANLEHANSVVAAGADLTADAKVALKTGIKAAEKAVAKADLRTVIGLTCAAREADSVGVAIHDSSDRIAKSVANCRDLKSAVGMP